MRSRTIQIIQMRRKEERKREERNPSKHAIVKLVAEWGWGWRGSISSGRMGRGNPRGVKGLGEDLHMTLSPEVPPHLAESQKCSYNCSYISITWRSRSLSISTQGLRWLMQSPYAHGTFPSLLSEAKAISLRPSSSPLCQDYFQTFKKYLLLC